MFTIKSNLIVLYNDGTVASGVGIISIAFIKYIKIILNS